MLVYKHVNEAFPLELKDIKNGFDANIDVSKHLKGRVKTQYETRIKELLFNIDEQNNSLMLNFRSVYVVFQGDPCNSHDYLKQQIGVLNRNNMQLNALKVKVKLLIEYAKAHPNNPEKLQPLYNEIIGEIDGVGVLARDAAQLEISENREAAKLWVGEKNDS
ncbi:MAG: hypothetical protein NTV43_10180 [Methylococcales bacterium]|nr:hypothetical protein [Methylococcales bacterium]